MNKIIAALALAALALVIGCQPVPFDQSGETNPEIVNYCDELDTGVEFDTGDWENCIERES